MKHFDLFSGYGGFTLALERVYGNYQDREHIQERGSSGNDSQPVGNMPNIFSGKERGDSKHPLCSIIGFSEIDKYASAVLKYHWPNIKNYGDITKINWAEVPDFDLLTGGSPCQDLSIAGKRQGLSGERSGLFYEFMRAVKEKRPQYFIWENVKGALSSNSGRDFAAVINEMAEAGYSLWWQVLNAKDFGVPQNRERIFVIGFRDRPAPEIFFGRGTDEICSKRNEKQKAICQTIKRRYPDDWNGNHIVKGTKIRRLTTIECERLMGLPDGWTKIGSFGKRDDDGEPYAEEISDSQRYKMCGNGVVVNVVEEIIKNLIIQA